MPSRVLVAGVAGAAALLTGVPALAATVVGATRVEIFGTIPADYAQVAEVEAFEFGSGDNVASQAEGGLATATTSGFGTVASNANDGNDNPADIISFWVPGVPDLAQKLTINFSGASTLLSLRIVGLSFCCQYRNIWDVAIYNANDDVLFSGRLDALTSPTFDAVVTFDAPTGAIPEPSTWAMMILGFGAAGSLIRSRRRVAATV